MSLKDVHLKLAEMRKFCLGKEEEKGQYVRSSFPLGGETLKNAPLARCVCVSHKYKKEHSVQGHIGKDLLDFLALHYPVVPKFFSVTLLSQKEGIFFFSPNGDRSGTTG